jgi:hypothetical protein
MSMDEHAMSAPLATPMRMVTVGSVVAH